MEVFMKALEKGKLFLLEPTKAFKAEQKTSFGDAFKYLLLLAIVSSVMTGVVSAFLIGPVLAIGAIASTYIFTAIGAIILGIILHISAWIFGARKGLEQTLKIVCFAATPTLLFSWIPAIGILSLLYSIVLSVIGLKSHQAMSTERAVLAVLAPLIIIIAIAVILAAIFIAFLATVPGGLSGLPFDPSTSFPS